MKLFHTSPAKIEKIEKHHGVFNDCLFFANEPYFMTAVKNPIVYSIEINDEETISEISNFFSIDTDEAERLLDGRDTAFDYNGDGEDDWWIQSKQGECAKKMGYWACEARDEQGTVYIIPMFGREKELVEEKTC